jgi:thioredoxin 1
MILNRRYTLAALALSAGLLSVAAAGAFASKAPFDAKAFAAAQASGKPVLIEVSAPWCPVCKAQKPILSSLSAKPEFAGMAMFEVDFDSQKEALKLLNVQKQSTLVVFKGKTETGRSTGDTNPAAIEALLKKAI